MSESSEKAEPLKPKERQEQAKRRHLVFPKLQNFSFFLHNFLRSCLTSAQCYQGNIYLFDPPISFILVSNSGMASYPTAQYKKSNWGTTSVADPDP